MSTPLTFQKVEIILNSALHWDDWIQVKKATAGSDLWDFVDPNKTPAEVPQHTRPREPSLNNIKPMEDDNGEPRDTYISDLSAVELEQWNWEKRRLETNERDYRER